jgi:hypothetical protein
MDFHEAVLNYAELKKMRDSQQISRSEFTTRVHELRVQDHKGDWWQVREKDGEWLRWNGSSWEWGKPDINERPYTPVISNTSGHNIRGSLEKFHALNADEKRKYVVLAILGIAVLYAMFVYFQGASTIGNALSFSNGIGGGSPGLPNLGINLGSGPETAVTDLFQALDRGDYSRAVDLMADSSGNPLDSSYKSFYISALSSGYGKNGELIEISDLKIVRSQKITETNYLVTVSGKIKQTGAGNFNSQPQAFSQNVYANLVNGKWLINYGYGTSPFS